MSRKHGPGQKQWGIGPRDKLQPDGSTGGDAYPGTSEENSAGVESDLDVQAVIDADTNLARKDEANVFTQPQTLAGVNPQLEFETPTANGFIALVPEGSSFNPPLAENRLSILAPGAGFSVRLIPSAGSSFIVASDITSRIEVDNVGIGFFAAAPVAQPVINDASWVTFFEGLKDLGLVSSVYDEPSIHTVAQEFRAGNTLFRSPDTTSAIVSMTVNDDGSSRLFMSGQDLPGAEQGIEGQVDQSLYLNPGEGANARTIEMKYDSGLAERQLGFFNETPVPRPVITGSRLLPEQALASLLTALNDLGLIDDQTTV